MQRIKKTGTGVFNLKKFNLNIYFFKLKTPVPAFLVVLMGSKMVDGGGGGLEKW